MARVRQEGVQTGSTHSYTSVAAILAGMLKDTVTILDEGQQLVFNFRLFYECANAQSAGGLCSGCRSKGVRIRKISLDCMHGVRCVGVLRIQRADCLGRRKTIYWPAWYADRAGMALSAIFAISLDAIFYSIRTTAERNFISRYKATRIVERFFDRLIRSHPGRVPDGTKLLAMDVAQRAGRRWLVVSAVAVTGERGSRLVAILPYGKNDEEATHQAVRQIPGMDGVEAVAIDNDSKLIFLVTKLLKKTAVLDTRHFLGTVLRPLVTVRKIAAPSLRTYLDGRTPSGSRRDGVKQLLEKPWVKLSELEKIQAHFLQVVCGEIFNNIYNIKNRLFRWATITDEHSGMAELDSIVASVGPLDAAWPLLEGLRRTVRQRRDMIAARYRYPISTSHVESVIGRFGRMHQYMSGNGNAKIDILRMVCREGLDWQKDVVTCALSAALDWRSANRPEGSDERR